VPSVHVYTRHRAACPHNAKRFWKKCDCPKWLHWNVQGKLLRQSADTKKWEHAQKKARAIEEKYERAALGQLGKVEQPEGITVTHAVLAFL
jgi:hypothetical protein